MTSIHHTALWVNDLEGIKQFYEKYFSAVSGKKYVNAHTQFASYMLTFREGGILEIMHRPDVKSSVHSKDQPLGWAHLAIGAGSELRVQELTEWIRTDGYKVIREPRFTGDGYFESVILDPEGNRVEITI